MGSGISVTHYQTSLGVKMCCNVGKHYCSGCVDTQIEFSRVDFPMEEPYD